MQLQRVCHDTLPWLISFSLGRRGNTVKRTWTIIGVGDVHGSFKWYQSLLGLPETAPGHDDFGQILDTDGTVLLCLHLWGDSPKQE
jgi:hypothetical protein